MTEHVSGSLSECLKMGLHILEQELELAALKPLYMKANTTKKATLVQMKI